MASFWNGLGMYVLMITDQLGISLGFFVRTRYVGDSVPDMCQRENRACLFFKTTSMYVLVSLLMSAFSLDHKVTNAT